MFIEALPIIINIGNTRMPINSTDWNTPEGEQKTTAYSQVGIRGAAQLSMRGEQREEAELDIRGQTLCQFLLILWPTLQRV